jgi:predicted DNA-binding transcriptional regulator AlpA
VEKRVKLEMIRSNDTATHKAISASSSAILPVDTSNRSMTGKEAARFLGLSHKTLNNWRVQGIGPRFVKAPGANGSVRYPLSELVAWRDAHLKSSTSQVGG